ncbi:hypothetical protein H2203_000964 [Taxawa tesnikishii (nom. ined.)]|nr:hypothetical protein H2203_000964 [Dothideales sp. JES 119]
MTPVNSQICTRHERGTFGKKEYRWYLEVFRHSKFAQQSASHPLLLNVRLLFDRRLLRHRSNAPRVAIEAYAAIGWERYADAGFSIESFGKSLPGAVAYHHSEFNAETIAPKVKELVEEVKREGIERLRGDF